MFPRAESWGMRMPENWYKVYFGMIEMFNIMIVLVITWINLLNLFNFIITYVELFLCKLYLNKAN